MPYLNEGDEPVKTVKNILDTADDVEIIAINDNGIPCDFGKLPVRHIQPGVRLGVGGARNIGIELSNSDNIVIIDAHIRFRDKWKDKVVESLSCEPETIFCTKDFGLDEFGLRDRIPRTGATFRIFADNNILEITKNDGLYGIEGEIPVIIGGVFIMNKQWFKKLRGYSGMKWWGTNEIFISLKSWVSGGSCKLIDIETGHLYKKSFNYDIGGWENIFYNKFFVAYTLFPPLVRDMTFQYMKNRKSAVNAHKEIIKNIKIVNEYRKYFDSIRKMDTYDYFNKFKIKYDLDHCSSVGRRHTAVANIT